MPGLLTCANCNKTHEYAKRGVKPAWCEDCRVARGDDLNRGCGYQKTVQCGKCGKWLYRGNGKKGEDRRCRECIRKRVSLKKAAVRVRIPKLRPCKLCAEPTGGTGTIPYCEICRPIREWQRNYDKTRARRCRMNGGACEPYTIATVAMMSSGICALCDRPVENAPAPHPLSPTVDHIIPIARGGDDTLANVQLAHWGCNSRKGAR